MFSLPMWIVWLILCGFFFLLEIFTITFLMFWPGVAAFVAFILAVLNVPMQIQIIVFALLSIVLMIFTKPITKKLFKTKDTITNVRTVIGKRGIVLKEIDNLKYTGQVKVAGEIWSATSDIDEVIPVDSSIEVISIDGVRVKVKKV